MGVEVECRADHRVAEGVHDHAGLDALGEQKRRAGVPEIVESEPSQVGAWAMLAAALQTEVAAWPVGRPAVRVLVVRNGYDGERDETTAAGGGAGCHGSTTNTRRPRDVTAGRFFSALLSARPSSEASSFSRPDESAEDQQVA